MDNNTFKKELDKITEREVVYDFVERIYIGKDFKDDSNKTIFEKNTLLLTIIKSLFKLFPSSLVKNITKLKSFEMDIPINSKNPNITFSSNSSVTIFRAISDRSGMDISSCMECSYNSSSKTVTISMNCDTGYKYDDVITIYVY